jgi:hypothetical protein
MKCLDSSAIDAAERFVWLSGRVIDRHRFAHLFRGAPAEPVLAALRPYRNPDGGFGSALEPDLRGPLSQPQHVEVALGLLDELDAFDDPMVGAACDYLSTITTAEGGVPFVLPSARGYPSAPWWVPGDETPASLNPTAALAGLLHRHGVRHPWLEPATAFCWERLDRQESADFYEVRTALLFLEHVPDRARAEAMLDRLGDRIAAQGVVALDPAAEGHSPLDLATRPDRLGRRLFADAVLDAHLDALAEAREEDGGWNVDFPIWTPATGPEWRTVATIDALQRLRAYGRWQ